MYTPAEIIERLESIDRDLANRQNLLEDAARQWFSAKRDREHKYATEFMKAEGTVSARQEHAAAESCRIGVESESEYEALKAVCRVLETRATIGQSLLKAHGRAGG